MYASAKNAYQQTEITTLPPERLVVLLYTHLVTNLHAAQQCMAANDIVKRTERLLKAQAIVQELQVTLNHEAGGSLAGGLAQLYGFWMAEILRINARNDQAALAKLIVMASELHEAWSQAADLAQGEPAVARTA